MQNLFFLVLVGFFVWLITAREPIDQSANLVPAQTVSEPLQAPSPIQTPIFNTATPNFRCDGREYCSQMSSREEAFFFIRNCPNTKMDGDNDGQPCENDSRF